MLLSSEYHSILCSSFCGSCVDDFPQDFLTGDWTRSSSLLREFRTTSTNLGRSGFSSGRFYRRPSLAMKNSLNGWMLFESVPESSLRSPTPRKKETSIRKSGISRKPQIVEVDFSKPQPSEDLKLFWKPARGIIYQKVQDCEWIIVSLDFDINGIYLCWPVFLISSQIGLEFSSNQTAEGAPSWDRSSLATSWMSLDVFID